MLKLFASLFVAVILLLLNWENLFGSEESILPAVIVCPSLTPLDIGNYVHHVSEKTFDLEKTKAAPHKQLPAPTKEVRLNQKTSEKPPFVIIPDPPVIFMGPSGYQSKELEVVKWKISSSMSIRESFDLINMPDKSSSTKREPIHIPHFLDSVNCIETLSMHGNVLIESPVYITLSSHDIPHPHLPTLIKYKDSCVDLVSILSLNSEAAQATVKTMPNATFTRTLICDVSLGKDPLLKESLLNGIVVSVVDPKEIRSNWNNEQSINGLKGETSRSRWDFIPSGSLSHLFYSPFQLVSTLCTIWNHFIPFSNFHISCQNSYRITKLDVLKGDELDEGKISFTLQWGQ